MELEAGQKRRLGELVQDFLQIYVCVIVAGVSIRKNSPPRKTFLPLPVQRWFVIFHDTASRDADTSM
jgi:hypothetical protein